MARTKVKSAYGRVCDAQRKFVKGRSDRRAHLVASKVTGGTLAPRVCRGRCGVHV